MVRVSHKCRRLISCQGRDREDGVAVEIEHVRILEPLWIPELTCREADVLELVAEGLSTREMGRSLHVSPQAVTYHIGNLLAKFQCSNRAGLVTRALVTGVLLATWPPRVRRPPGARWGLDRTQSICED